MANVDSGCSDKKDGPLISNHSEVSQAVLDAFPFYVLLVDEDHRIVTGNTAVEQDLGKKPRDLCGEYCPQAIHGMEEPYPGCPLEQAVKQNRGVETEMFDPDSARWMNSAVYPTRLLDERQRKIYLHYTRDITAEKQAEMQLSRNLEHHKALERLLKRLQACRQPKQVFEELIDLTMSLSWMDVAYAASGFLFRDDCLHLVAERNMDPEVRRACARVALGSCVCGTVAASGQAAIVTPDEIAKLYDHPEPVEHGHAALPLVYEGRILGVLNFYIRHDGMLDKSQLAYLEAAVGVATVALTEQVARQEAHREREEKRLMERRLLRRILTSQEDERKRVSRELHDDLGQVLSALLLEVRAADGQGAADFLAFQRRMEKSIRSVIDRVSSIAWELRPSILDDYGLPSAISRYVQHMSKLADVDIDYQFVCPEDLDDRLPPEVELILYRITQESLNNVIRHAHAHRVSVILIRQPQEVAVLVEDDGVGYDVNAILGRGDDHCLGLIGMQERASLLHGRVRFESTLGKGSTVKVTLPLGDRDAE